MKKVMFIMAAALLMMTQCKKENETPNGPAEGTVKMTVTAGSGAKTDISTETGAITWSAGDKLYVSKNGSWLGCLELVSGENTANGTFTGDVTGIGDGDTPCHFFYLGKGNIATTPTGTAAVSISFATQDGTLADAMKFHAGYGSTDVTVTEGEATGYVEMKTKIAIAHINFTTDGTTAYTGAVTMGGTGISNTLSVSPDGSFSGSGTDGITIGGTTGERYVTLIPTGTTDVLNVAFTGDATGSMTFANGIQANKFYGMKDAIAVTLEAASAPKFSVGVNTTVEFAPGNLWYGKADGETTAAFHFEANQWETTPTTDGTWDASHVSHFFWSNTTDWQTSGKEPYASSYSYSTRTTSDVFFTNSSSFQVDGEAGWRTLSEAEWDYLLNTRTNASSLRAWKDLGNNVKGLVILPDGDASVMSSISSTADLETYGAVFLPAAGHRNGEEVCNAGSDVGYWSGTPYEDEDYEGARCIYSNSSLVCMSDKDRGFGYPVRLVR